MRAYACMHVILDDWMYVPVQVGTRVVYEAEQIYFVEATGTGSSVENKGVSTNTHIVTTHGSIAFLSCLVLQSVKYASDLVSPPTLCFQLQRHI